LTRRSEYVETNIAQCRKAAFKKLETDLIINQQIAI